MTTRTLRCAIYTRKSTEEGLEQQFNSLDAQREACAAYITSQRHEGWTLAKGHYDDGGFPGGSMERPALRKLLAEVQAGRIDVIVVYKVDRLTRSLADFAKIVEVLDAKGASFVSVTQAFNTTTSMGRLTLNVLLSFAQFEREVTGERIRDKIAASKRKGLWMGGPVPLGYAVEDRKLVVVEAEAERVRHIMRRYLALRSANQLVATLERDGVLTKVQHRTSGPHKGGIPFRRGSLFYLLKNRIYRGMTVHKGEAFPGEHQAIVPGELWDAVQIKLASRAPPRSASTNGMQAALLRGLLSDEHGRTMVITHSKKGSTRYRYYTSRGVPDDLQPARRVSAEAIERTVVEQLQTWLTDQTDQSARHTNVDAGQLKALLTSTTDLAAVLRDEPHRTDALRSILSNVMFNGGEIELHLRLPCPPSDADASEAKPCKLVATFTHDRWAREDRMVFGGEASATPGKAARGLIELLQRAQLAHAKVLAQPDSSLGAIADTASADRRQFGRLLKLSYLSPKIVERILAGEVPRGLTCSRLLETPLPLAWNEQERVLGFC